MILSTIRVFLFALMLFLVSAAAVAAQSAWQIVPNQSAITFTATQNNAPVTGKFTTFSGDINFDPAQLNSSNVKIVVNIGSVATSYKDVGDTLKTADWFDIKHFPQAVFKSSSFTKTGDNKYQSN